MASFDAETFEFDGGFNDTMAAMSSKRSKREAVALEGDIDFLLRLIINNSYVDKEIFLRELISNASNALDKIPFESFKDDRRVFIDIVAGKTDKTISIIDSGVGMTDADLINNLRTIVKSGTNKYFQSQAAAATDRIGVGFCSSYIVAKRIVIVTKHDDDEQCVWELNICDESFFVTRGTSIPHHGRGTRITLYLKEDQLEYLEERRLKDLIKKYSAFIRYPISLSTVNEEKKDAEENERKKKKIKPSPELTLVNKQHHIWRRKPEEITKEEYATLYKCVTNELEEHLGVKHFNLEVGQPQFKAVLFVPERAPLAPLDNSRELNNVWLYVRGVFIMDNCKDIIPRYLSFVKMILDFNTDLPLNLFRDNLRGKKEMFKFISQVFFERCIELFTEISENKDEYGKFYKAFSDHLKLGILQDDSQNRRAKLAYLLRFHSSKIGDEMTSLDDYVTRMKNGQNDIYYIAGESKKAVEKSPFIEKLRKKGYEVLYMVDTIDESAVNELKEFKGKRLVCVTKEGLKFDESEEEKKRKDNLKEKFDGLCKVIKEVLNDEVERVVISDRLVDSPCCLVTGECCRTANMERLMKAQFPPRDSSIMSSSKKIMEINPGNAIMEELRKRADADENDPSVKHHALLLFETALLTCGFSLDDPNTFGNKVHRILKVGLSIAEDDAVVTDSDMPQLVDNDVNGNRMEVD